MRFSSFARAIGSAGLAVVAFSACADETTTVLKPLPNRSFNFVLIREGVNIPRGSVIATRTGNTFASISVAMEVRGLEVLRDPYFYQVWMAAHHADGDTLSAIRPLTSTRVITTTTDTTISEVGDFVPNTETDTALTTTGSFNAGGPGTLVRVEGDAATTLYFFSTTGGRPAGTTAVLLVTIDSNPAALTEPDSVGSQGRLWARGLNTLPAAPTAAAPVQTRTVALTFGNFHAKPALEYVFRVTGRGRGAVLENENVLVVFDSSLARPPRGYFYETHLVTREDDENFYNLDTVSIGAHSAPYPDRDISLFNADVEQVHPVIDVALPSPQIYAAETRVDGDTIPGLSGSANNPFRGVALILVTLENKFGTTAASPATILAGTAPVGIRLRE